MELFFLNLFAILRPMLFIDIEQKVLGLNLFELAAIGFVGLLFFALIFHMAFSKKLHFSSLDLLIFMYVIWCFGITLAYPEHANIKAFIRWIIPFLTYIVAKNVLRDRHDYINLLFMLIIGFTVPILASTILIAMDKGVDVVSYWTGLTRYKGVYDGPHEFGHNMVLFICAVTIYVTLYKVNQQNNGEGLSKPKILFLASFVLLALYCLYQSQVRTAYLGLILFAALFLYFTNKRLLIIGTVVLVVVIFVGMPVWKLIFFDIVQVETGERPAERIASGRPYIWSHNLNEFRGMTLDRQIAGAGIGNKYALLKTNRNGDSFWESHNDYLQILISTGYVGLLIYLLLTAIFLRYIFALQGIERHVFLAMFIAAMFMNFSSNSWISRFGIAQMFYLLMSYVELRGRIENHTNNDSEQSAPENQRARHCL